jgi:hypothetical protein
VLCDGAAARTAANKRAQSSSSCCRSQCLAKLERGHRKDRDDAASMVADGLVDPAQLLQLFEAVEPNLFRYPAIDPRTLRAAVVAFANR